MKRLNVILYMLSSLAMMIVLLILINKIIDREINYHKVSKSNIGKQVIIKKDTLLIIDYSSLLREYSLDNGLKIDKDYCEKIIIK